MTDVKRQLAIRTGAVKRLCKEVKLYRDEEALEQSRVVKLKSSGADSHDVKHAVFSHSNSMIHATLSLEVFARQSSWCRRKTFWPRQA